jgi:Mrr N-terminal domain
VSGSKNMTPVSGRSSQGGVFISPAVTNLKKEKRPPMPIPEHETLKSAILRLLADDANHSSQEIRERLRVQFNVAPQEDSHKLKNGKTVFEDGIDRALANLQGAPRGATYIEKVGEKVYRIMANGKAYLKQNSNP